MPRVLVSGAGSIGQRHLQNALRLGCDVCVYDPKDAAVSKLSRASFAEALDIAKPDAVILASPPFFRLEQLASAWHRDIPAYVEKPLCLFDQLDAAKQLLQTFRGRECVERSVMGYQLRFIPEIRYWREHPSAWERVYKVCSWFGHDVRRWHGPSNAYTARMGVLLEASHEVDYVLHWFSCVGVRIAWASVSQPVRDCGDAPSVAVLVLEADVSRGPTDPVRGPAQIIVELDYVCASYQRGYEIWRTSSHYHQMETEAVVSWRYDRATGDLAYVDSLHSFLFPEDGRPSASIADGFRVLQFLSPLQHQEGGEDR